MSLIRYRAKPLFRVVASIADILQGASKRGIFLIIHHSVYGGT
jgi:hypothetical protein